MRSQTQAAQEAAQAAQMHHETHHTSPTYGAHEGPGMGYHPGFDQVGGSNWYEEPVQHPSGHNPWGPTRESSFHSSQMGTSSQPSLGGSFCYTPRRDDNMMSSDGYPPNHLSRYSTNTRSERDIGYLQHQLQGVQLDGTQMRQDLNLLSQDFQQFRQETRGELGAVNSLAQDNKAH